MKSASERANEWHPVNEEQLDVQYTSSVESNPRTHIRSYDYYVTKGDVCFPFIRVSNIITLCVFLRLSVHSLSLGNDHFLCVFQSLAYSQEWVLFVNIDFLPRISSETCIISLIEMRWLAFEPQGKTSVSKDSLQWRWHLKYLLIQHTLMTFSLDNQIGRVVDNEDDSLVISVWRYLLIPSLLVPSDSLFLVCS